jgi:hypothetical protein
MVRGSLGKKQDPISKITRAKTAGGMAQVVERLPSNYKTLSSNQQQQNHPIYCQTRLYLKLRFGEKSILLLRIGSIVL